MKLNSGGMVIVSALAFGQPPGGNLNVSNTVENVGAGDRAFHSHLSASGRVDSFEFEGEGRLLGHVHGGWDEAAARVFAGVAAGQQGRRDDDCQERTEPPLSFAFSS